MFYFVPQTAYDHRVNVWLSAFLFLLMPLAVFARLYHLICHVFLTAIVLGMSTIAFQTGVPTGEVAEHLQGELVSVYVPTTPNPTGGYFLMLPRSEVIELDMSVDEALTYVISMGSVPPSVQPQAATASSVNSLPTP